MIRFMMLFVAAAAFAASAEPASPRVKLETSKGVIVVELDPVKAPITVGNFLGYVKSGFFDGTIFHRVIPGFMIQGGGFTPNMEQKPTNDPIVNEAANGLANKRGTIAMARTSDPNSATSQFFINLVNNSGLDKSQSPDGMGYCVFGKVVQGLSVVDAIAAVQTGSIGPFQNVPLQAVVIKKASVVSAEANPPATQGSAQPQPK